jgi:hypothetical protein
VLFEKVQRRATKLIVSLRDKLCDERMKKLKLTTLEKAGLEGTF